MTMIPRRWFVTGLLTVTALTGLARDASAQISAGVIGGGNSASLTFSSIVFPIEELATDFGRRTGFIGGAFVDVPLGKVVSFEGEVLFSQKGATFHISLPDVGTATGDYRLHYLEVPLLGRVGLARFSNCRVFLLAGPSIGVKLGARVKVDFQGESETQDFSDGLPSTDVGLAIGGRIEAGKALAEIRYTHGFTNLAEDGSVKNRVVSFLAGWRF